MLRPSASWYLKLPPTHAYALFPTGTPQFSLLWLSVSFVFLVFFLDDMDGLGGSIEDRSVFGVENSSMFLECSPKSQRALIYWQLQRPNDDRKQEVCINIYTNICHFVLYGEHSQRIGKYINLNHVFFTIDYRK